jgi:hypothetical protein
MIAARHLPACALTCVLVSFLMAATARAQTTPAETLIIVHANVIDGVSNTPLMDQTVVVADGRIASVGNGGSEEAPRQGRVIDLKGRWLLPGFVVRPPSRRPASIISPMSACVSSITAAPSTCRTCAGRGFARQSRQRIRQRGTGQAEYGEESRRQRAAVVEEVVERDRDVLLVLIESAGSAELRCEV